MAKRYQRGNHNQYIKEQQTTQWPKDTKGVIIINIYQRRTDNTMAKRYQRGNHNQYIKEQQKTQWPKDRGNHNQYIEEQQTTQWPKDTKGVIIINISKNNRQRNGQKIPKG